MGFIELSKFYDEGSYATLAAIWIDDKTAYWMTYGDSVVFCFNTKTKILETNIENLTIFNHSPYLISCSSPLEVSGFKSGVFQNIKDSILFCASDALAHYILACYYVCSPRHRVFFAEAFSTKSKNANYIKAIQEKQNLDFEKEVLNKLIRCSKNKANFKKHIEKLQRAGKIASDDYSICFIYGDVI